MTEPHFTVVIPTRCRNQDLAICLGRLAPGLQTLSSDEYEVIVSDDDVLASAQDLVTQRFPWAEWIAGPRNGPAANRNHAAQVARGAWIVFIDDDCIPAPGLLAAYNDVHQRTRARVVEGCTTAGGVRDSVDMEAPINLSGGCLWSCNFAIERELFLSMGGFDTGFPGAAMEDVEFRTRLRKAEVAIQFADAALVTHPWRRAKGWRFGAIYAASVVYFCSKHPDQAGLFTVGRRARTLAAALNRNTRSAFRECSGRGLVRYVTLEVVTFFQLSLSQLRAAQLWQ